MGGRKERNKIRHLRRNSIPPEFIREKTVLTLEEHIEKKITLGDSVLPEAHRGKENKSSGERAQGIYKRGNCTLLP